MTSYTYSDDLVGDLYKDARGFRPGSGFWSRWASASPDQKQTTWNGLEEEMRASEQAQLDSEARAAASFESVVKQVTAIVKNTDRANVVRYLHQAYDTGGDDEYLEHRLGLKAGYIRRTCRR